MMKTSFTKVSLAVLAVAMGLGVAASAQQQGRLVSIQGGRPQGGGNINILGPSGTANRPGASRPEVGVTVTITIPNGRYFESNVMSLSRGQHSFSSFMTPAGISLLNANSGKETLILSGFQSFDTSAINSGMLYLSCGAVVDINRRIVDTTRVIDGCASSPNDGLAFWTGAKIDANGNLTTLPSFVTGVRFSFEGTTSGRDTVLVSVDNLQRVITACQAGSKGNAHADTAMNLAIASTALSGGAAVGGMISTGIEIGRAVKQGEHRKDAQAAAKMASGQEFVIGTPQYQKHEQITGAFSRVLYGKMTAEIRTTQEALESFVDEAAAEAEQLIKANAMGDVTQQCFNDKSDLVLPSETLPFARRINKVREDIVNAFTDCSKEFFKNQANASSADTARLKQLAKDNQKNNYAGSAVLSGLTALMATGGAVTSAVNIATINKIKEDFEDLYAERVACAKAVDTLVSDIDFHQGSTTATKR